eukprot:11119641-Ditylum_brightwellii.AAC.1
MSSVDNFFEYIVPFKQRGENSPHTLLGDHKTSLEVKGYGIINVLLDGHRIHRAAFYVPALGTTLLYITDHMKYRGCFFHAEDNEVQLVFPTHIIHPDVKEEIQLLIEPARNTDLPYISNKSLEELCNP